MSDNRRVKGLFVFSPSSDSSVHQDQDVVTGTTCWMTKKSRIWNLNYYTACTVTHSNYNHYFISCILFFFAITDLKWRTFHLCQEAIVLLQKRCQKKFVLTLWIFTSSLMEKVRSASRTWSYWRDMSCHHCLNADSTQSANTPRACRLAKRSSIR